MIKYYLHPAFDRLQQLAYVIKTDDDFFTALYIDLLAPRDLIMLRIHTALLELKYNLTSRDVESDAIEFLKSRLDKLEAYDDVEMLQTDAAKILGFVN